MSEGLSAVLPFPDLGIMRVIGVKGFMMLRCCRCC
jgi:hypothetical protein